MQIRTLPLLSALAFMSISVVFTMPGQAQTSDTETSEQAEDGTEADAPAEAEGDLDPADANAAPFPPGRHAALTKQVCTSCHMANMVLQRTYTYDEAVRFYQIMVTSDIETEEARSVIEYLSTTLAP